MPKLSAQPHGPGDHCGYDAAAGIFQIPAASTSRVWALSGSFLRAGARGSCSSLHGAGAADWYFPQGREPAGADAHAAVLLQSSRGISSCAWLPWITALVPPRCAANTSPAMPRSRTSPASSPFCLPALAWPATPGSWQFAILFAFSAIMGAVSLTFLKRIPDAEMTGGNPRLQGPGALARMVRYAPFKRLVCALVGFRLLTAA